MELQYKTVKQSVVCSGCKKTIIKGTRCFFVVDTETNTVKEHFCSPKEIPNKKWVEWGYKEKENDR